jgi:hypothetical protein
MSCFSNCTSLSSIIFHGQIELIWGKCFSWCTSLTSISTPNICLSECFLFHQLKQLVKNVFYDDIENIIYQKEENRVGYWGSFMIINEISLFIYCTVAMNILVFESHQKYFLFFISELSEKVEATITWQQSLKRVSLQTARYLTSL